MFTLEITVPKQHVPEKFDRFIASARVKVKETGEYVKLTRSAVPKILALKCVVINGLPLKDKSTKVKPNDFIVITLANIDSFKVDQQVQSKSEEQQELMKLKQQNQVKTKSATTEGGDKTQPWWDKNKNKIKDDQEGIRPHAQIKKAPITKKSNAPHQQPQQQSSNNFKLVGTNIKLDIVYEDDDLAIINKPAGMLVHPVALTLGSDALLNNKEDQTHTLVNALIHRYGGIENLSSIGGIERPGIVHRLDKDTAGMIIIARNNNTHQKLQTLFEKHTSTMIQHTTIDEYEIGSISNNEIEKMLVGKKIPLTVSKKYHCIVLGKPKEQHGFINKKISRHPGDKNKMVIDSINGKEALTEYKVLKVWENVDAKVLDNQRNKTISKSTSSTSSSNQPIVNSTLSEYDNVMNQLSKKKKNNKKSTNLNSKNLNSKMQFLSVDSDEDDDEDDQDEDEKVEEEEEDSQEEESEEEDDDEDEEEESEEEESEEEESEEEEEKQTTTVKKVVHNDEDDDEDEDEEEENYDEILLRLQQKTKMITSNTFSLLEVTLHTGRSHQIRVHMASENIPIVGDPIYSSKTKQFLVPYLLLASMNLKFVHPISNEIKEFSIPYPSHFKNFTSSIEGTTNTTQDSDEDEEDEDEEEDSDNEIPKLQPIGKSSSSKSNNNKPVKKSSSKFVTPSNNPSTTTTTNTKKKNSNYINSLGNVNNIEKDLLSEFVKNKK